MKKLFAIITLFALVFTSCQKDEMMFMESGLDTITATIESTNDTKTSLDNDYNVVWSEGDKITVFIDDGESIQNVTYTLSSVNDNGTGVFTKTTDIDISGGTIKAAIYPYDEDAIYTDGSITQVSTYVQTGANSIKIPMAAKVNDGTNISFKNIGAVVKVTTPEIPSAYTILQLSSATSSLAGKYSVSFNDDGTPSVTPINGEPKFINLQDVNQTQTFYFPIFAGNYSDLTVKAKGTDKELVLIAPKALTAERSKLYYTDATFTTYNSNEVVLNTSATEQNIEIITTTEQQQITVAEADGQSVTGQVNISINSSYEKALTLNLPSSTVLLSGKTTYSQITASTAENTLILGNGVTVGKVIVNKGNVQVNKGAVLNGIELGTGVSSVVVIDNGGTITDAVRNTSGVTIVSTAEWNFKNDIAKATENAVITLNNNLNIASAIVINKNITINLNGKTLTSAGDGFEVTAGTLTITGNGTVNAGTTGDQWVAVWANGGNAVIENGTYTVVADKDNTTNDCIYAKGGQITINGGTFSNVGTYVPGNGGVVINAHNSIANSKVIINGGTFNPAKGCVPYEDADVTAGRIIITSK